MSDQNNLAQPRILVDADACPVKDEIYQVALRRDIAVTLVSNSFLRVPPHRLIELIIVNEGFDAADDWIAAHAAPNAVIVTADILLAERVLKTGGAALGPNGKPFTPNSIGAAVATRAIMADLRAGAVGQNIGGAAPFSKADRSRFLSALDNILVKLSKR